MASVTFSIFLLHWAMEATATPAKVVIKSCIILAFAVSIESDFCVFLAFTNLLFH